MQITFSSSTSPPPSSLAAENNLPEQKIRTEYSDGDPDIESAFYALKHTLCPAILTENLFMGTRKIAGPCSHPKIINLHIEGLKEYLDNEAPKAFR